MLLQRASHPSAATPWLSAAGGWEKSPYRTPCPSAGVRAFLTVPLGGDDARRSAARGATLSRREFDEPERL